MKATSIVFVTESVDTAHQGVAVIEIAGDKRHAQLTHDYSVVYNGIKVHRSSLSVTSEKPRSLAEIVLAVHVCMVVQEHV